MRFLRAGDLQGQRLLKFFLASVCLSACALASAAEPHSVGSIERLDPALDKLVPTDAKMEVAGEGYIWCEGPAWVRDENFLLFSDIPNNAIMRWDAKSGSKLFLKPATPVRTRAAASPVPTDLQSTAKVG